MRPPDLRPDRHAEDDSGLDRMRLDQERHRYRENLEEEVARRTSQLEAKTPSP